LIHLFFNLSSTCLQQQIDTNAKEIEQLSCQNLTTALTGLFHQLRVPVLLFLGAKVASSHRKTQEKPTKLPIGTNWADKGSSHFSMLTSCLLD
jgi:hypothetical protein